MDLLQSQILSRVQTIKGGQTEDDQADRPKKPKIKQTNKFDEVGSDENESESSSSDEAD